MFARDMKMVLLCGQQIKPLIFIGQSLGYHEHVKGTALIRRRKHQFEQACNQESKILTIIRKEKDYKISVLKFFLDVVKQMKVNGKNILYITRGYIKEFDDSLFMDKYNYYNIYIYIHIPF